MISRASVFVDIVLVFKVGKEQLIRHAQKHTPNKSNMRNDGNMNTIPFFCYVLAHGE